MNNVIDFPDPRTAIEAEQRQEALEFARVRLTEIAEIAVEKGFQRMLEVTRSVPYWETLTVADYIWIMGEAFRSELERRHILPKDPRTARA